MNQNYENLNHMILETTYKNYKLKLVYEFINPTSNVIRIKKVFNENGDDIYGKCNSKTLQKLRQLVMNDLSNPDQ